MPFNGTMLPILAPEHLAICRAMCDRRKDWLDIEKMLIANDELDLSTIEAWLKRMVGEKDGRLERLEELKSELAVGRSTS